MNKNKLLVTVNADDLPPNVTVADLEYPTGNNIDWETRKQLGLEELYDLVFYKTSGLGWLIATLHIKNPSRRQRGAAARTYAVGINDGKVYRVGLGPHVLKTITVYLSKTNLDRLGNYIRLWKQGLAEAGTVRDRISSRRAQGQIYRSQGRTSWRWDS